MRTAVVTGGSRGIGRAISLELAAAGARVVLTCQRDVERAEKTAEEIRRAGGQATPLVMDVLKPEDIKAMAERVGEEFGGADILVNNAGVMLLGPIEDAPTEEWDRMIDLNLKGLIYTTHAALPHLLSAAEDSKRGCADLVNISSVAGRIARSGSGVYNLTKFGVGAFSESVRQEFAERRVRTSIVEPGAVATELTDHLRDDVREAVTDRFAGIDRLQAEDIADAIAYTVTRPRHVSLNEILIRPTEQVG
jgi:NADP-dependent 3-hydroxy acid dehydrogenase YdfG